MNIRLWLASVAGAASLAAVLAFTPTSASAQQPTASAPTVAMRGHNRGQNGTGTGTGTCSGTNFVDANGDGVCDNAGTGTGVNFVDANGDGVCDNAGTGTGQGGSGHGHGRS